MPEAPGSIPQDRLDRALDLVLDTEPARRASFVAYHFRDDPHLASHLLAMLEASEGGRRVLMSASLAAHHLLLGPEDADGGDGGPGADPGDPSRDGADPADAGDPDPDATLPTHIGSYLILERLGAGGMGTVYLARRDHGDLDRLVALKVVRHAAGGMQVWQRFQAEQRILSRLEHPNVARLYDVGVDPGGAPYFVMERVEGEPIHTYADRHQLDVEARVALVRQVVDALSYAHQNLVVHRDVKPGNILVTAEGTVKLLDFGVAKVLDETSSLDPEPLTRPEAPLLTPEYASPEQIRGEAVTTATDVYATGVLLYELLTGRRPYDFADRSPLHVRDVVETTDPPLPSRTVLDAADDVARARATTPVRLARILAGDLDAIVLTALEKEPARRYASTEALAQDLDRYRRREAVLARTPTWGYRLGRFARRHRTGVVAGSLVAASLVAGLAATSWQARIATREAQRAERVKELLVDLFEGADPDVAGGADLTAVQLLARGQAALLAGLEGEPRVRAELQQIVGSIYTSLGAYDRAGPLLSSAVALRDRQPDPEEQAEARAALADWLYATGDFGDGERVARERLALERTVHARASTDVAAALTDLATFVQNQGRLEEAEELLRQGLEMDRELDATEAVAVDLNNLGTLLTRRGDYDGGIGALEESLDIRQDLHAGDHTDVATSMANLAWALSQRGDFDRADTLYEATLDMRRRLLGQEHPLVATVLNNQASMRQVQGRLDEATRLHGEALRIRSAVFGPDHADVAASLNNMGITAYYQQDYATAEARFREALRIFRLHYTEDHPHVLTGVGNLGAVLRAQGRLDEAAVLIRATLEARIRVLGPDHHNTGGAWNNLGGILRRQGRYAEAEEPIRNAVRIFQDRLDPEHPDLADARLNLGKTLVALGRGGEWADEMALSCAVSAQRYEPDHPFLADCRSIHGLTLLQAGDTARARVELSEAIHILETSRADDPFTHMAREALDELPGT